MVAKQGRQPAVQKELIGLRLEVVWSKNKALVGLQGQIIDETKETFSLSTAKGEKRVLKAGSRFRIAGEVLDGQDLAFRPEDRIKR